MTIYIVRGAHANQFELQNYTQLAKTLDVQVVTSKHPLTDIDLSTIKLFSPTDLPNFPYRRQILNRLIGGEQWLLGLQNLLESNGSNHRTMNIFHTAETYTPYTHQAVQLRKENKISKLVCTCWETIPGNNEKFARLRKWKKEAYQYVDLFHTPTKRAKDALIEEGVDEDKIVVIPYGVDQKRFKPTKRKKNKRPIVLTVARLEKEKGMDRIELLARELPQLDFVVVGRGSYVPLEKNIKVRSTPYKEIHKEYQQADLFYLPSRTTETWEEQYGMALIEAMSCSLPIVAHNTGAIGEVLGGVGVLLPDDNSSYSTQVFERLIDDKKKLQQMSQASLTRAKNRYNSNQTSKNLATLYTHDS